MLTQDKSKKYSWKEEYKESSEEPYGSNSLLELLKDYLPNSEQTIIRDSLNGQLPEDGKGTYMSIGQSLYLGEPDRDHLLAFVEAGGDAFIACQYFPYDLMFYLYFDECEDAPWNETEEFYDTSAVMNFYNQQLVREDNFEFTYVQQNKGKHHSWNCFRNTYFCGQENGFVPLGTLEDEFINFIRIPYKEGFFYLHTNPIVFTNYFIHTDDGRDYANGVFSYLRTGPLYWDEYSRQAESVMRSMDGRGGGGGMADDDRLQFILNNPPLAWAWYLLLAVGLLFLILHTKRRQRVIPVLEPNTNTSLEYLTTIGRLYFMQNDNRQLSRQQAKLWRQHIWQEYALRLKPEQKSFGILLAARSGRPIEIIEPLLVMYSNMESARFVNEETMINFHRMLERFYHYEQNPH